MCTSSQHLFLKIFGFMHFGHGADYNCLGTTMGGEGSHREASSQGLRGVAEDS